MINVELAYAPADEVELISLSVQEGVTIREAVEQSGICSRYPGIDLGAGRVGIYGKLCSVDQVLAEGDRIEIYRPLLADPKEARRKRASRQKSTPK